MKEKFGEKIKITFIGNLAPLFDYWIFLVAIVDFQTKIGIISSVRKLQIQPFIFWKNWKKPGAVLDHFWLGILVPEVRFSKEEEFQNQICRNEQFRTTWANSKKIPVCWFFKPSLKT